MTIGVAGLGRMGLAVAESAARAGQDLMVWNRTPGKAGTLESVPEATTLASLIAGCDMVVLMLPDYDTTMAVLSDPAVEAAIPGVTLVQLCSGTPEEARALAGKVTGLGGSYLDGKIFTYPARVGAGMTRFAYSGDRATWDKWSETLMAFGGASAWLGEDAGFAAASDLAWLSFLYGAMSGLFQALAFTRAEGMPDDAVFGSLPSWLVEIDCEAKYTRELVEAGDYHGTQATLDVHYAAMQHLVDTAKGQGISAALPEMMVGLAEMMIAKGFGDTEMSCLLEAFCKA